MPSARLACSAIPNTTGRSAVRIICRTLSAASLFASFGFVLSRLPCRGRRARAPAGAVQPAGASQQADSSPASKQQPSQAASSPADQQLFPSSAFLCADFGRWLSRRAFAFAAPCFSARAQRLQQGPRSGFCAHAEAATRNWEGGQGGCRALAGAVCFALSRSCSLPISRPPSPSQPSQPPAGRAFAEDCVARAPAVPSTMRAEMPRMPTQPRMPRMPMPSGASVRGLARRSGSAFVAPRVLALRRAPFATEI